MKNVEYKDVEWHEIPVGSVFCLRDEKHEESHDRVKVSEIGFAYRGHEMEPCPYFETVGLSIPLLEDKELSVSSTISERGENYGSFTTGAATMQALKETLRANPGYERLEPYQREALDMIMHKASRIVNGNPNYIDSWRDISGFSQLVCDELEKTDGASDSVIGKRRRVDGTWVNE